MKRFAIILSLATALSTRAAERTEDTSAISDEVVRKVDPSVVAIQHERAVGSGFIISEDGYILSNGHVVQGSDEEDPTLPAKAITVILSNEQKYPARVIGFSMDPDVSLLKIEADHPLKPVEFGDSRAVQTGQRCFAVGTPVGLKRTFTGGLLSNVDRMDLGTETKVFQTDAAINPGNSGGPLFDQEGRVLGINTYGSQGANNLGFTIPLHVALVVKDHLMKHGRFVRSVVPYYLTSELYDELAQALGVPQGLLISYVLPGSSAEKAGLRDGDVITAIDGKPCVARTMAEASDIEWEFQIRPVGSVVSMTLVDSATKQSREVKLTLEAMEPMPKMGRHAGEIIETRYDAIGLGVRDLALIQRISQDLPPVQGVMVTTVGKTEEAEEAGLMLGDVITRVAGKPTPNAQVFREVLESALAARSKYIEIEAQRRNLRVETALAPHYVIRATRVALIVPSKEPEYVDLMRREMMAAGADVKLYSLDGKPVTGSAGTFKVCGAVSGVNTAETDVLLFAGGPGGRDFAGQQDVQKLVSIMAGCDKTIAAVGPAALALVQKDGPLKGRKLTIPKEDSASAIERGANYTGRDVETDARTVTTTGFDRATVRKFVTELIRCERDRK